VGNSRNDWQEKEYVLCQFGSGKKRAMRAYRKFMEEGKKLGRRPELVGGGLIRSLGGWSKVLSLREKGEKLEHDSRVLGSGDFHGRDCPELRSGHLSHCYGNKEGGGH
jgi:hypothetical protein